MAAANGTSKYFTGFPALDVKLSSLYLSMLATYRGMWTRKLKDFGADIPT